MSLKGRLAAVKREIRKQRQRSTAEAEMAVALKALEVSDAIILTQLLTRIDSSNPCLSASAGEGEKEVADFITAWLKHRHIEVHRLESHPGRPSVVGVVRGSGEGKSLMLNGHIDTVSLSTYGEEPLSGTIDEQGHLHGRGCLDMKAGVAAAMVALEHAAMLSKQGKLRGDVILAAVADEENLSWGTEDVLTAGWRADGAIISEPTMLDVVLSHKGFVWIEIDVLGVAAHGSRPAEGVDAILMAGHFLVAIEELGKSLPQDKELGKSTLHGGLIRGGEEPSSYPAKCTVTVEVRTVPGQTVESLIAEIEGLLEDLSRQLPAFKYSGPRATFSRPPFHLSMDHPFAGLVLEHAEKVLGGRPNVRPEAAWTDCALLDQAGIPVVMFGPRGKGLHANDEWVEVGTIEETRRVLEEVIGDFCC